MKDSDLKKGFSNRAPSVESLGNQTSPTRLIWGNSAVMEGIRAQSRHLAQSDCSVLIVGETGTGKGMLAREIHEASSRARASFVHVDCAALAPSVIESEFFGHEKGAFTGATTRRPGRFELAAQGTIFLDEIAELPPGLQGKLLRVLEDRRYERVGGNRPLPMTARVLAATHHDLSAETVRGEFRRDLYFRLAVAEIVLPPIRDRSSDLESLLEEARRVVSWRLGRIIRSPEPDARGLLQRYAWPGNAREVFNLVERIAVCWPDRPFDAALVGQILGAKSTPSTDWPSSIGERSSVSEMLQILAVCRGNVSQASRKLGIPRSTLRYRLDKIRRSRESVASPQQQEFSFFSDLESESS